MSIIDGVAARRSSLLGPGSAAVLEIDNQRRRAYTTVQDDGDVRLFAVTTSNARKAER